MRTIFNLLVTLFLSLSMLITAKAQPSEPGYPAALMYQLATSNLPIINLPSFNNQELIAADTCDACGEGYGVDANVSFNFWENNLLTLIENPVEKVEIYRTKIVSPTAQALHVIFSHFELTENEQMFIYSPNDTNRVLGAYSMHNNKPDLSFISNRIADKELIIEVNRRPKNQNNTRGDLIVGRFIHVFKNRDEFGSSLNCHVNVICSPWYNTWCNQIRSVIKLLRHKENQGWYLCSGALINNLNYNFDPLILTANHCVDNGDDYANWVVFFNFQSITCSPSTNGNDLMTVSGVNVIATDNDWSSCPDIALLRLRQSIPEQYNVFFSGWNRRAWSSLPGDDRGIGIHHPAGDVKKISEGYRVNPLLSSCVKVNWTTGYTEGGSSGSPLFITSKEIIGVLSWSWHEEDHCADDANFFYSWLHKSWTTLWPYLAPTNSDALTLDGIDPISSCQPVLNLNRRFFPGNDWQIKNQITIQAAQQVNVANMTETTIEQSPFNVPSFNSDYIIRAGNKITISPGFKVNSPFRFPGSGIYIS
ncbi:MAG: trypsin-like serine protease, partial [Bacteroidia bacterium]|nr:trypsin-like serine protease [Bacteroidia bacterium]